MNRKPSPGLTDAERRIMQVLWHRNEATVREVTDELADEHGLAYTTVLTTIRIMVDKGFVDYRKDGRAHRYRPLLSREHAQRRAVGSLLSTLFEGSPHRLAQRLIDDEQLSLGDIEALRDEMLARAQSKQEKDE